MSYYVAIYGGGRKTQSLDSSLHFVGPIDDSDLADAIGRVLVREADDWLDGFGDTNTLVFQAESVVSAATVESWIEDTMELDAEFFDPIEKAWTTAPHSDEWRQELAVSHNEATALIRERFPIITAVND